MPSKPPRATARRPKSDDLSSAVRRLLSELEKASSPEPASPKEERERYILIQVALSKFVRKVGGTLEQTRHIWELAQHLAHRLVALAVSDETEVLERLQRVRIPGIHVVSVRGVEQT